MHFLSNAASANESIKKYSYMRKSWVFLKQGVLMKNFVFQGGLRTKAFFGNFFKYIIYKIIGMPILPSMQRLKLKYKPFSLVGVVNQSAYAWKRNGNIQKCWLTSMTESIAVHPIFLNRQVPNLQLEIFWLLLIVSIYFVSTRQFFTMGFSLHEKLVIF